MPRSGRWRRSAEAALAVGAWMGLGWTLGLDGNRYLLLGIPITLAFQLGVRRRPLHRLWVRDVAEFRMDRTATLLAALLAVTPAYALARLFAVRDNPVEWVLVAWSVAAITGAVAAGFAFRRFTRETLRSLARCVATAGTLGITLMVAARLARPVDFPLTADAALTATRWFLLYLPVGFVLEEVFFRGTLDAHVHGTHDKRGTWSALFVSALWGVWHLPIRESADFLWAAAAVMVVFHSIIGVPLSIYWRRSGNLAVPATAHALVSAVRNALL
ncbi:MAG: CPBP family intramembrane metalloprotease [Gemmatimonadota bacterium]|nr:CPBP family intramembrane metalloprotease [Gemmatimonadota bacterium]